MMDMDKDLKLACNTSRRRKWIVVMAALGFTGYSAYRVYHLPSVARKRAKISKFFAALSSAVEAFSDSAECMATISKDLKEFIHSDSDQIPHSLKQISKLARSDDFSDSLTRLTQAIIVGAFRGYDQSQSQRRGGKPSDDSNAFTDRIMAKLLTASGSGFVSAVVGSFARNLVMAFFSIEPTKSTSFEDRVSKWVTIASDEKTKELIGVCIQTFVSSAISVYLEKTPEINIFDRMFSGLTNPNHEKEMRELLVSISNGAVKTLIRTSHQVLSTGQGNWVIKAGPAGKKSEEYNDIEMGLKPRNQMGKKPKDGGWASKVRSTLAVSKNKKVILDLTGRMTFEMVRSFLEVLMEKIFEGMKRSVDIVNEEVIEKGLEMVRFAAAKTSVIATVCLSLCFHVLDSSSWFLVAF